jgi:hypothetical protein
MKIFSADDTELGRVGGNRSLLSRDAGLVRCWQEHIHSLAEQDEVRWRERVRDTLAKEGYRAEIYT